MRLGGYSSVRPIALFLALAAGACVDPGEPTGVRVQTDAAAYVSAPLGEPRLVRFAVVNLTDRSIFVSRCGDHVNPAVDRWVNGAWVNFGSAICLANVPWIPLSLGPRMTYEDSTGLYTNGVFQLRLGTSDGPAQAMTWALVSNRFQVQ
jgi:hypothetical protein